MNDELGTIKYAFRDLFIYYFLNMMEKNVVYIVEELLFTQLTED